MNQPLHINTQLLNSITAQAQTNPRLRMNHNLHDSLQSGAQRLLNALEPGTILPVHRHRHTAETYILLRGRLRVFFHDSDGRVSESFLLDPLEGQYGVHIPAGQWHSLEVLQSGSVIFEVKDGPYEPLGEGDVLTLP
jgi:cupin fold WbuC family metalloprotein